jgi:bifunctional polynucleotide phosphatase/kinase
VSYSYISAAQLTRRASGKTSFYRRYFPKYEHVNQDKLGNRDRCMKAAREALQAGRSVVVDNTNRDRKTRKLYVDLAKEQGVPAR